VSDSTIPQVHDRTPRTGSFRSRQWRADESGFSMSWRGFAVVLAILGGGTTASSLFGLLGKNGMEEHNRDANAHNGLAGKVEKQTKTLEELSAKVDEQGSALLAVRNGFYDFRAEQIADEAAERVRGRDESREVFKRVKAQALDNLSQARLPRSGLEKYFEQ